MDYTNPKFNIFDLNMKKNKKIGNLVVPGNQITQLPCTDTVSQKEFNSAVQNIPTSAIFRKRNIWRPRENGTISITFCPGCEPTEASSQIGNGSSNIRPSMTLGYIDPPFRDFEFDDGTGSKIYKYRDFVTDKRNYCIDKIYPVSGNNYNIPGIFYNSVISYGIMDTDMSPVTIKLPKISEMVNNSENYSTGDFFQVFLIRDTGSASKNNIKIVPADGDTFYNISSNTFTINTDFGHVYIFTKLQIYDKDTGHGSWATTDSTGCTADWTAGSTVVHEFGHALGMMHEHQNDLFNKNPLVFDEQAVRNSYPNDSSAYINVLERYTCTKEYCEYAGSRYDPESIMLYWVPDDWVVGQNPITKANFVLSKKDKEWLSGYYPVKESSENYPNIRVEFVDNDAPEWKMAWVKKMVMEEISPIVGINFSFVEPDGTTVTSSPVLNIKTNKKQMALTVTREPIVGNNISLKEEKIDEKLSKRMEDNISLKELKAQGIEGFSKINLGACEISIIVIFCLLVLFLFYRFFLN